MSVTKKTTQTKALLAIAFAGGMFSAQLPALSVDNVESTDSLVQGIANNTNITPEVRAWTLMGIARSYLDGGDPVTVEVQNRHLVSDTSTPFWPKWRSDSALVEWANHVSSPLLPADHDVHAQPETNIKANSDENKNLANAAIKMALKQLETSTDKFTKLNLYFIASRMFQRTGNTDGAKHCNEVLEAAFQSCEGVAPLDENEIRGASSVLNSMAFDLLAIRIPDLKPTDNKEAQQIKAPAFTEHAFRQSEKLKMRALTMVDRLTAKNHLRRKAHRDLSLWYLQLGKPELAEKEKRILFELVGTKDDSILWPRSVGCGQLQWWPLEKGVLDGACGMG